MGEEPYENTVFDGNSLVDGITGEVISERTIDRSGKVRAFSYDEYIKKRHYDVLVPEEERRLMGAVYRVGKEIGAPEWLINEAFWFLKKARVLKTKIEFKGKPLYPFKQKYIYAVYFVLSCRFGLLNITNKIASLSCNDDGERCYVSRKKGDKEFRRYIRSVRHFASFIYPNRARDPVTLLDEVANQYRMLPDVVYRRAREHAIKMRRLLSGRKSQTVVASAIAVALDEVMPSKSSYIVSQICKLLNVSEPSVKNLVKLYQEVQQ